MKYVELAHFIFHFNLLELVYISYGYSTLFKTIQEVLAD